MPTRDDEIAEQYARQYDDEHHVRVLGPCGEWIDEATLTAQHARMAQAAVDAKMAAWFGQDAGGGEWRAQAEPRRENSGQP